MTKHQNKTINRYKSMAYKINSELARLLQYCWHGHVIPPGKVTEEIKGPLI
jgi:hypothetical protein